MTAELEDYILHPSARLLWRSERTIQIELGAHAVIVDGLPVTAVRQLLPRSRTPAGDGRADAATRSTLATLHDSGLVWPATVHGADERLVPPQPRLACELAALSTQRGETAARLLAARRDYCVAVHGAGRVGAHLAAVLAAAGVGRVYLLERDEVKLYQALPGGVLPGDESAPLCDAAAAAVARAAPRTDTTPLPMGQRPDLVVLAVDEPVETDRHEALHQRDCPHLLVRMGHDHGVVGPLVIPGLTSCLRCADLHRLDRDPAWTALAVQLSIRQRASGACDVALATTIAGMAAMQALSFLDGDQPATVEGTLEVHLPDWRVRRRSWPIHPDCDCTRSG